MFLDDENASRAPLGRIWTLQQRANSAEPSLGGSQAATAEPWAGTSSTSESLTGSALLPRALGWLIRPQFILLLLLTIVIPRGITLSEPHYYTDETRHVMNGVFLRDLLVDHPFRHPIQYTYEYYAKYPATAIPHWPPLFYLAEGMLFLIFGISAWASRLTVFAFALLGAYFWYRIAEKMGSQYRAFFSAVIFGTMPYILLYERVVMLEIPAIALCLASIYFWLRWVETERAGDLWILAGFVVAAFLTSQTAIFLVFFFGLEFLLARRFHLLKRWDVWAALAAALVLVVPWYLLSMKTLTFFSGRAIASDLTHFAKKRIWLFYIDKLRGQLGVPLLCLGGAGAGWALVRAARRYRFLLIWIISCYLCFVIIPEKDPRHSMIWIPPLAYFALVALEILCIRARLAQVATAGLAAFFLITAFHTEPPRVNGVKEIAQYVLSLPGSDLVYYQGDLDGDFIFHVRRYDPERSHMVARSKQIVVTQITYQKRQVLQTPEAVREFFRTWGIRYAVVETPSDLSELGVVREALASEQFELLRTFSLSSNHPNLERRQISIFRYRGELQRTAEPVIIPMMTIHNDIRADLNRLVGRPWPN